MALPLTNVRFVWRSLLRNPAFTAAAVLSLALGIGANTAIFTLADQMLLRSLPVKEPRQLVMLNWNGIFIGGTSRGLYDSFSYPAYRELRDGNPGAVTGIAARFPEMVDIADHGPAQRAIAELVTGNYFDVLGVQATLGRVLTPADDHAKDAEPYVVLSYDYWRGRFGSDPTVLNRVIDLNGNPMTVVGVAQRGFRGFESLTPTDVFVPMMMKRAVTPTWDDMERRNSVWLKVFARLKPGVSAAAAATALQAPYSNTLENDIRTTSRGQDFQARYRKNTLRMVDASKGLGQAQGLFEKPLRVLLVMVGVLLLIACVNVANLLITRSAARQKEIAIRLSLGATRSSLIRLIMTESLCLAGTGGLFGILLSTWISSSLVHMLPLENIDRAIETTPDWRILAFTAGLSLLTALVFGLVPALQISRPDLAAAMKSEGGAGSAGGRHTRLRKVLVAAQVTLSLILLTGAGLFARSLYALFRVDVGIRTQSLLAFSVDPSLHKYTPERSRQFFLDLQNGLKQIPGAAGASGAAFTFLASDNWENTVNVEGYRSGANEDMQAGWNQLMPGFFSAVGAPLIAGREFTERDTAGAPRVTIVNETFVKRFYPHENPVGRHIGFGGPPNIEIVGVVKDIKGGGLKEKPKPWTYTAELQDPHPAAMTFYVRTFGDPLTAATSARQVTSKLDSSLPVYDLKTVSTQIDETHFIDRLFAFLSAAFGLLATVLASVGLYGVTAYAVTRRTQEIGIRVALGAGRDKILGMVMREVLILAAAGVAVGIPAALALGRLVESQLFGIKGTDPAVLAGAVIAIASVSALAGYIPARRAARIDPISALRYE